MSKIAVVGAGVVGTATGAGLAQVGHDVAFVDVDPARVDALRARGFAACDELQLADGPHIVFLTLPTPNDGYRWHLDALLSGTAAVGEAIGESNAFQTVVVRSTVPPGCCEQQVVPRLEEASGRRLGEGFSVASNPEFLRARSALEDFLSPWMTVIGSRSPRTLERLTDLLAPFGGEVRRFSDPAAAELVKCVHNLFNATKISFWNEIWSVCSRLRLDSDAVASVVARSAEGSTNPEYGTRGGEPYGGACLPKDTKGFLGFAGELGVETPLLAAVDAVNEELQLSLDAAADPRRDGRSERAARIVHAGPWR
ncbi:MAG: 2-dehydropantoate 2-reductase N-terminal domain-containing protein [Gaiellaceae bacterium]